MKKNHFLFIVMLCLSLVLMGSSVLPELSLSNDEIEIDITYYNVSAEGSNIVLTANYNSYGDNFEIAKDIVVATDENFINKLDFISCAVQEDGLYRYEFEAESPVETIYVSPPVVYVPATAPETSFSLSSASLAATNSINANNNNWFSITEVQTVSNISPANFETLSLTNMNEANTEMSAVRILIDGSSTLLPRFPKLNINGTMIDGVSILTFDDEMNFIDGEFIFYLPAQTNATLNNSLSNASLIVTDALEPLPTNNSDIIELTIR